MKDISTRSFLHMGLSLIGACGLLCVALLWSSNRSSKQAVQELADAVESVVELEKIQQNLGLYRRLTLNLTHQDSGENHRQLEQAKKELLEALQVVSRYSDSPAENRLDQEVRQDVTSYLQKHEALRAQGMEPSALLRTLNENYNFTQEAIQDLVTLNLNQTREMEIQMAASTRRHTLLFSVALSLLASVVVLLGLGFRWLFFQPVLDLRKLIENFELGNGLQGRLLHGAKEIQSIASSFLNLTMKLTRQNDVQLRFLSTIAHDIKNPLSAIRMASDLMVNDHGLSEDNRKVLAIIGRQTDHLKRLVEDLLDTTRIEAGKMELRLSSQDIRKLITDAALLYANLSSKHEIIMDLPKEELRVVCDSERLTQVLNNLLSNAIKYSPEGCQIQVRAYRRGQKVLIDVSDSGVGILPKDLNGIFEPFRRASTSRENIPGVGLGLSSSRKIMRAHQGGDIWVQSKPGEGSTFTLCLEADDSPSAMAEPGPQIQL